MRWLAACRQLPEVESVHRCLGVPSVSARFGTAPFFWNTAMQAVGLLPRVGAAAWGCPALGPAFWR